MYAQDQDRDRDPMRVASDSSDVTDDAAGYEGGVAESSTAGALGASDPAGRGRAEPAADGTDGATLPSPIDGFETALARAMQAAAARQRERIASVVGDDAAANVETVRNRAVAEADEFRRLAEADLAAIEHWSASEIERIRGEAASRAAERRASLEDHLARHRGIIDAEIASVDHAVTEYGATLDAFLDRLARSDDPVEVARLAGTLPTPPDFATLRAVARAAAVAREDQARLPGDDAAPNGEPVPVMDPAVIGAGGQPAVEPAGEAPGWPPAPTIAASRAVATSPSSLVASGDPPDTSASTTPDDPPAAPEREPVHASPAVRLLRAIAPWAVSSGGGDHSPSSERG